MKKLWPLLLAGFVLMDGCAAKRQINEEGVSPVASQTGSPKGLDFLADIPSLKGVSLKMPEAELLNVLRQQKLVYQRSVANSETSYYVQPKPHVNVYFGFREGKCTGIQRMRD